MHLKLIIDARPLDIEIDDVIAGLLALRLDLPENADQQAAILQYLSEKGSPWLLDEEHMRKRIFRRLILDIADPALIIRYLMVDR
ncbi:hypothetical protein PAN31117_04355 [Pandoraea anapnoica]|uniref:Uncharacterized protein n=1 Tax=Pandoraea anapnoica TaxID=2508301 RepID=A0A5E5AHL0_9BURK|nr:hypothetical protein [Pandoraea anapnoica]VVE72312.1 hypothetical protein PAN31117_04355 [Pandoraea anapnoica]